MNQILEYSPVKNSGGGSSGSDKIVRIFALILIIFALCFIAIGAYGFFKKNKPVDDQTTQAPIEAKIEIQKLDTTAIINVSHDRAIEKVIYKWDDNKETTEKGDGTSTKKIEIPLSMGQHTLTVKVVDVDGVETIHKETINSENGTDIINPVIEVVPNGNKLKIIATDETEIAYVTYKWNNDEEFKVEETDDSKKKIEFDIEILKGKNDLTVIAVDANQRTTRENRTYNGVTNPEIKIIVSADKKHVDVDCSHEKGIDKIFVTINGDEQEVGLPDGENTNVHFDFDLPEGNVSLKVKATSTEQTTMEAEEEIIPDEVEVPNEEQHMNENIIINIERWEDDHRKARITANYVEGIKEVKLNVNDNDYTIELPEENPTDLELQEIPLFEGNNKITFTVIGVNNTENTKVVELQGE